MLLLLVTLSAMEWAVIIGLLWLTNKTRTFDEQALRRLLMFPKQRGELLTVRNQFEKQIQMVRVYMSKEAVLIGTVLAVILLTLMMLISETANLFLLLLILFIFPCPILVGLIERWQKAVVERINQLTRL